MKNPRGNQKFVRVKTARGRKNSSTRWLQRQLNDPYVAEARKQGYRSRAAFKIIQLHEKLNLIKPGMNIVDLGAAPGGWMQVMADIMKPEKNGGKIIGIDYLEIEPLPNTHFLQKDFTEPDAPDMLKDLLDGQSADLVISDMAAPTTGHQQTDHLRIIDLAERAYSFTRDVLKPNGTFLSKIFQGGATEDLLIPLKLEFKTVKHIKPGASRDDSSEMYVVAQGFKGKNPQVTKDYYSVGGEEFIDAEDDSFNPLG